MNNNDEALKRKIRDKDNETKKYKEKLELIKQHYGIQFDIDYFENKDINKIKFYDLEYKNSIKNISVIYDAKLGRFNFFQYEYDNESVTKNMDDKKILNSLNKEKKLKLIIAEIDRLNNEYQFNLKKIEEKYQEKSTEQTNENNNLELRKKIENS